MSAAVEAWFGEGFQRLHPMLQQLHRSGGVLSGQVNVSFGRGLAGVIGRRLARKLGIPPVEGAVDLKVSIHSTATALHWDRTFNENSEFKSVFTPVGHYPDGHWIESSGSLRLRVGVGIVNGGWVWEPRGGQLWGLPIPTWLLGHTSASKQIELGLYQFNVRIDLPLFGNVLAYGGQLTLSPSVD